MSKQYHNSDLPTIFDVCIPRKDIQDGLVESELAADLSRVAEGEASADYADPAKFFASTYPTKGIKELLRQVLMRLAGSSSSSVFWLNTSFGGGKTHALIALLHAVQSPPPNIISEFVDPALLPKERVRIAVFDGQNADISSGHSLGEGIRAHTPWGEIAYSLAGKAGYRRVSDNITDSAPGADTIRELLGSGPVLILLDELALYLRKAKKHPGTEKQFAAFLTSLIKAVEISPNATLVYTIAIGSAYDDKHPRDAYSDENSWLLSELESISSRKATLMNPTEEGETIQILRRRLFEKRDESKVDLVVDAYKKAWRSNRDKLPDIVDDLKIIDDFKAGYPLHPDVLNTLISKTSTLENFQRIRGMLRLLGYVIHNLWKHRDDIKPTAIHLHHFDIGNESIHQEVTSKIKQDKFDSAIEKDIACDDVDKTSCAQKLDKRYYPKMLPFTTYIARTIFMHTLAFNQQLKGIDDKGLRYSMLSPGMELGYVDEALNRFRSESRYLYDNRKKPTQFQATPNLNQAIQRNEQSLDCTDLESEIDQRIKNIFQKGEFDLCLFPGGHEDIPDDVGKPKLIIPKYSDISTSNPESPPDKVKDIFEHKGIGGGIRIYRNNLVFLVAFEAEIKTMYSVTRRYLAISKLASPDSVSEFEDYQQKDICDKKDLLDVELNTTILGCYKYAYYPTKGDELTYTTMDWKGTDGQRRLINKLRDMGKIRTDSDHPDLPESLIQKISGLERGKITTQDFRNEFYRATALPMLIGDRVFNSGISEGIKRGVFVYKSGDLLCGKDDPDCTISIDAESIVYTTEQAKKIGIWPRRPLEEDILVHKSVAGSPSTAPGGGGGGRIINVSPTTVDGSIGVDTDTTNISSINVTDKPSQAVRYVLDELRKRGINKISKIQIKSKDDIFSLVTILGRSKEFTIRLETDGDYQTNAGSYFRFEFGGTLKDAEPVLEFLKPQLQNIHVGNINVKLDIILEGDTVGWLEKLSEQLRFVDNNITISGIERVQGEYPSDSNGAL